jgi:hypothetical protein
MEQGISGVRDQVRPPQVYSVDCQVSLNQPGGKNEWFLAIDEN